MESLGGIAYCVHGRCSLRPNHVEKITEQFIALAVFCQQSGGVNRRLGLLVDFNLEVYVLFPFNEKFGRHIQLCCGYSRHEFVLLFVELSVQRILESAAFPRFDFQGMI